MAASPEEAARWYAYFYDGTTVLKNKLGLRNSDQLEEAERFLSNRRAQQILDGHIQIERTYNLAHLQAIHRALFQDVYPFAGELRTVVIGKKIAEGEPARVFLSPGRPAHVWMDAVTQTIKDQDWGTMSRTEAADAFSDLYTNINFGHFFREGSGRTGRIFLQHVAQSTPYKLDYSSIDPDDWNRASAESIHPGIRRPAAGPLDYQPLRTVFADAVTPKGPQPDERQTARTLQAARLIQDSFTTAQRAGDLAHPAASTGPHTVGYATRYCPGGVER